MASADFEVVFVFDTCYLGTTAVVGTEHEDDEDLIIERAKQEILTNFGTVLESVIDFDSALSVKIEKMGEYR